VKRALAALPFSFVLLGACHTPAWRAHQIHEEIETFNAPRRDAAIKRALDANHATLSNVTAENVFFSSDVNECADAEVVVETQDKRTFTLACTELRKAAFGYSAEAKTTDGSSSVLLIGATPLAGDTSGGFALANGANGELLVIRPILNVTYKRKIWHEGTCNFMPSPVYLPRSAAMFVVPPPTSIRTVDVTYDGHDTEVVCDHRVE
jgi:hypothetical protein